MQKQTFYELKQGKPNFPAEEVKIIEYWRKIKPFVTQLNESTNKKSFVFYDGPPFATGKPHYGHILAGTIKDVVCRYKTQTNYYVERRFGWDCHGVPVEHLVEEEENINTREDIIKLGIKNYNQKCRNIVLKCVDDWKYTVERMGRWIDFKKGYKTMDLSYMESVWWVFKQLYTKNLVYKKMKVLSYSTGLNTPLSNFEASLNYKDELTKTITVGFTLLNDNDNTSFLAWTTTPWTLLSNLALCVNPNFKYVKFKDNNNNKYYISSKTYLRCHTYDNCGFINGFLRNLHPNNLFNRNTCVINRYFRKSRKNINNLLLKTIVIKSNKYVNSNCKSLYEIVNLIGNYMDYRSRIMKLIDLYSLKYTVVKEYNGKELVGKRYKPLFNYFSNKSHCFRVVCDEYVTKETGTGIVHQAPGFGEDDLRVCINFGIYIPDQEDIVCPIDHNGKFIDPITLPYKGLYVLDANNLIIKYLKNQNKLWKVQTITHRYPYCWRSNTPLLNKATSSWFIKVTSLKENLIKNNKQTRWVPNKVKNRFDRWLEDARDWSISRDRYWGTPIPIWTDDDETEFEVIGSVNELQKRITGNHNITDLHRENIDQLTIKSLKTGKVLHRIKAVFDCWFESGSMPYAKCNYPLLFPADFIAEGLDQTRGWFYTLLVLSTALFDKPAFKNVIVNGILLNKKGDKMSKSKRNYPEPNLIFDEYGSDALRIYLCQSRAVHGDFLKFKKIGVQNIVSAVLSRLYNSYNFFIQNVSRFERNNKILFKYNKNISKLIDNIMDKWILSEFQSLIKFVINEMEEYRLYTVATKLIKFIDLFCNTYIKLNNLRIRGLVSINDANVSLQVLYNVLLLLSRLMSPLSPFIVETMYLNLRNGLNNNERKESIHFESIPMYNEKLINKDIERKIRNLMEVIKLGRYVRDIHNLRTSQPLSEMVVYHQNKLFLNDIKTLKEYIFKELNVKKILFTHESSDYIQLKAEPNYQCLAEKLGLKKKKQQKDKNKNKNKKQRKLLQKKINSLYSQIRNLDHKQLVKFVENNFINVCGELLTKKHINIVWKLQNNTNKWVCSRDDMTSKSEAEALVLMDYRITNDLYNEMIARAICNHIQQLKKTTGLVPSDQIDVYWNIEYEEKQELSNVFYNKQCNNLIEKYTSTKIIPLCLKSKYVGVIAEDIAKIKCRDNDKYNSIKLLLAVLQVYLNPNSKVLNNLNEMEQRNVEMYLQSQDIPKLKTKYSNNAVFKFSVNDKQYQLVVGKDFSYFPFV